MHVGLIQHGVGSHGGTDDVIKVGVPAAEVIFVSETASMT